MDINLLIKKLWAWSLSNGIHVVITIVVALIALKLARVFAKRLVSMFTERQKDVESQKRAETLGSVIGHVLKVMILLVATMMVLKKMGIEITPILAAAGVVGLAVGFGAQNLVADVISGFFILLEDQIRVGDVVQTAGKGGLVKK